MKVVKLNATGEFNRYACLLVSVYILYSVFFFSVQVICLHVLYKAHAQCTYACVIYYLSMRHHKVSHDIILGTIM